MKSTILLMTLLAFAVSPLFGQTPAPSPKEITVSGYVVDQHCAEGMIGKPDAEKKAAAHARSCALMEACAASGYGVFTEGKWVNFDSRGNAIAKVMLTQSKREKGLSYQIKGVMNGDQLAVTSMGEIALPATTGPAPKSK